MWKRKVRVWKHSIYFYVLMKKIPFGKNHIISPVCGSRDTLGLLEKSKKNLKFSQSEIIQAEQDRNKMGISNLNKKYELNEIISGDTIFCATGVTNGDLVKGIVDKGDIFEASTFALHKDFKINKKITNCHKK